MEEVHRESLDVAMAEFEANSRARYGSRNENLPESETEYFYSRRASMDEFSDSGGHNHSHNQMFADAEEVEEQEEEQTPSVDTQRPVNASERIDEENPISRPHSQNSFIFVAPN